MTAVVVASGPDVAGLGELTAAMAGRVDLVVVDGADALAAHLPAAEVVVAWDHHLYAGLASSWPRARAVRWVHSRSAGIDGLLSAGLAASPATLTNTSGVYSRALAEFALGAVFFFARRMRRMVDDQAHRRWAPFEVATVAGATLGICGLGSVGRAVATAGRALGMRVLATRRDATRGIEAGLVDRVHGPAGLREMLAASDHVVACLPLTPATRGLIGAAELAAMRPDAHFINIGRGEVVDQAALVAALRAGRLAGAALDVYEVEPVPADSPLYDLDNVLLSPHCADNAPGTTRACVDLFLANLDRYLAGAPLLNVVDKAAGY